MGNSMRGKYGCKYNLPHDLKIIHENPTIKIEVCLICNRKYKWSKGYRGRVNNIEYLKAHARNFAQQFGKTKRLFYQIYEPQKLNIVI